MPFRPVAIRLLPLCVSAGLLAAASAVAQEAAPESQPQKYAVLDQSAAGDVCTLDEKYEVILNLNSSVDGVEVAPVSVMESRRREYADEVLAADAKGPTNLRRSFSTYHYFTADPFGAQKTRRSPLQGMKLVMRRQGGKVTVTPASGKLDPKQKKQVTREFGFTREYVLPNREVRIGETWVIDPSIATTQYFRHARRADMRVVFQEDNAVRRPHLCPAPLHRGPGDTAAGMLTAGQLEGDIFHALDLQRPLQIEMHGPLAVDAKTAHEGHLFDFNGDGTLELVDIVHWKTVAGKPVNAKPGPVLRLLPHSRLLPQLPARPLTAASDRLLISCLHSNRASAQESLSATSYLQSSRRVSPCFATTAPGR